MIFMANMSAVAFTVMLSVYRRQILCYRVKERSLEVSQNKLVIFTILDKFNVHGSVHVKNILIYIQQDATLQSLFYLETALHVSGGTTTHHQERK
jgi:hypothetical protein